MSAAAVGPSNRGAHDVIELLTDSDNDERTASAKRPRVERQRGRQGSARAAGDAPASTSGRPALPPGLQEGQPNLLEALQAVLRTKKLPDGQALTDEVRRAVRLRERELRLETERARAQARPRVRDPNVVDLTSSQAEDAAEAAAGATPRAPGRGGVLPRRSPARKASLHPAQRALAAARAAAPRVPEPEPEPPGPKCGICLDPMGGATGKAMASGPCGHVYCRECLAGAVRAQKKCPTCRKNLKANQIHQVFLNF